MTTGMANGCFDLLHDGHFHFLARCKEQCDYLIVAINSDASVKRLKGITRPRQGWTERCLAVMETGLVEAVIPFEGRWDKLALEIRPQVIFQGEEYRKGEDSLIAVRRIDWKENGHGFDVIPIVYIERLPGYSTTLQIEALAAKTDT